MHEKAPCNKLSSTADEKTLNATELKDALNHSREQNTTARKRFCLSLDPSVVEK